MRSARPAPLIPYRQGDLDGLCGIYAVINAIKLVIAPSPSITDEHWYHLFSELLAAADDAIGAVNATAGGIEARPLRKLLNCAVRHMEDEHDIEVTIKPLLAHKTRPHIEDVCALIKEATAIPRSAVIISFGGPLDHWTVVTRVTATTFELFDSVGLSRVHSSNLRMSYEASAPGRRQHIVSRNAIFVVRVAEPPG